MKNKTKKKARKHAKKATKKATKKAHKKAPAPRRHKRKPPAGGLDLKAIAAKWRAAGKPGTWIGFVKKHRHMTKGHAHTSTASHSAAQPRSHRGTTHRRHATGGLPQVP